MNEIRLGSLLCISKQQKLLVLKRCFYQHDVKQKFGMFLLFLTAQIIDCFFSSVVVNKQQGSGLAVFLSLVVTSESLLCNSGIFSAFSNKIKFPTILVPKA